MLYIYLLKKHINGTEVIWTWKTKLNQKRNTIILFKCKNYEEEYAKLSETVEILERCGFF